MESSPHRVAANWQATSRPPDLLPEQAHVWRFDLDRSPDELERFAATLSDDERQRAARFTRAPLCERFTAGRGLLRIILSRYLDLPAADIRFSYSAYGKPAVAGDAASSGLHFNLSHSAGLALLGLCRGRRLGVDVEAIRQEVQCEELAERFFSQQEVAHLLSLPARERRDAFFRCWTRKEAYIKAVGLGLALGLDCFDVSLLPGEPARLLAVRDAPAEADRWSLEAPRLESGFMAAVAIERPLTSIWYGVWPAPGSAE